MDYKVFFPNGKTHEAGFDPSQRHWRPGEPIPEGVQPSAIGALIRHALGSQQQKPRVVVQRFRPSAISPQVRADYQRTLDEHTHQYIEAGETRAEARRLALDDLGCAEFWDLVSRQPALEVASDVPAEAPAEVHHLYCARCESIGHGVGDCPFSECDTETQGIAMRRRARRSREKARTA